MTGLRRCLVLGMTLIFLGLSIHAFSGLSQPGLESYSIVACAVGLGLAAVLYRRPLLLFLIALVAGPALGFLFAHWDHVHAAVYSSSGLQLVQNSGGVTPPAVGLATASVLWIATLCGWQIGRWRQPWPVVALGTTPFLLRADLSPVYSSWFPLFVAAALAIVVCTYLPSLRAPAALIPAAALAGIALICAWHLPTAQNALSLDFSDPLPSFAAGGQPRSLELSLAGRFKPGKGTVMTVQLSNPFLRPYWRTMVFDHFDGHSWSATQPDQVTIPAWRDLSRYGDESFGQLVDATVRLDEPASDIVSAGRPEVVSLPTRVSYAQYSPEPAAVQASKPLSAGSQYTVEGIFQPSGIGTPTRLSEADLSPYLQVPSGEPARVRDLALNLVRDRPNPVEAAFNIQSYLQNHFRYDPNMGSAPGQDAVAQFLFGTKRGYCAQFASAMVMLARDAGIPARLASGYATGTDANGTFTVHDSDGHSWPELYFPRYGWVPFEPTPSFALDSSVSIPHRGSNVQAQYTDGTNQPGLNSHFQGTGIKNAYLKLHAPTKHRFTTSGRSAPNLLLLLVIAAIAVCVLLLYSLRPRSVESMYRALASGSFGTGAIREGETPQEFLMRFERDPAAYAAARVIVELYMRQKYASRSPSAEEVRAARRAWTQLRRRRLTGTARLVPRLAHR